MSSDPPEQVGKGLFGYRRSAVNQIIADRDIMLRQAEGRVRAAESKVAELEGELSSQRERNSRMDEQLDRLRQQLDLLMTRTEGMAPMAQESEPQPEAPATWVDEAPAEAPWTGDWEAGTPEAAPARPDESTDDDEAAMFGQPTPFGAEAEAATFDPEAAAPGTEAFAYGGPQDDDVESPAYEAESPAYESEGSPFEQHPFASSGEPAESDDIPYGVQMDSFGVEHEPSEESGPAWMAEEPSIAEGAEPSDPMMFDSGDRSFQVGDDSGEPQTEANEEPAYGFDPFGYRDETTEPVVTRYDPEPEAPEIPEADPWNADVQPAPAAEYEAAEAAPVAQDEPSEPAAEAPPAESPRPEPVTASAAQESPVSSEATDITNRFLTEELTGILSAAEESAARIVERARATTQHQIAQSNRLWREVQSEVTRFATWRDDVEPVIRTVQSKVEGVRERIEEVPERIRQALAPMADAISSIDTDLAELAAACSPPLLLAPGGLEGGEPLAWDVKTPEVGSEDEAYDPDGSEEAGDGHGDAFGGGGGELHAG